MEGLGEGRERVVRGEVGVLGLLEEG